MNEIKRLRTQTGLTQAAFARKLGIPVRTIQKWEIGQSSPPVYVINMIQTQLEGYSMINMETVSFISTLNELAAKTNTKNDMPWIRPFSECTSKNQNDCLFYDEKEPIYDNDDNESVSYNIVLNKCVDEYGYHHDITSVYSDIFPNITIRYRAPHCEDIEDTGRIEILTGTEYEVLIHNGEWYVIAC